jgi:ATP synthase protein I
MLRVAALPSLVVGLVVAVVALFVEGGGGFWSAIGGALLASAFFATGQLVLYMLRSVSPAMLLMVALLTYLLQVVILLAVYMSFVRDADADSGFSATAFGVSVIAATAVWVVGLIRVAKRERIPLYQLGGDQP